MKKPVFTGAGVAIITPMYEDGSINFDELGRIIDDQIAHGTDAIVICGTTGECSTMTDEEQLAASSTPWSAPPTAYRSLRALAPTIPTTAVCMAQSPTAVPMPCCW